MLDLTPFYAESGGQESDHGPARLRRRHGRGARRPAPGARPDRAPRAVLERRADRRATTVLGGGRPRAGAAVPRAHTATHLVHRAFREALGRAATQAGSLNAPGPAALRLRLTAGGARHVLATSRTRSTRSCCATWRSARSSPRRTRRAGSVRWRCSARSTATRCGSSRSASSPYARELCGGTHVARSAQLGAVSCCRSPPSAPACAGSRRSSASTLSGTSPASTCCSARSPRLSRCTRAEEVPERVTPSSPGCATPTRARAAQAAAVLACAGQLAAGARDVGGVAVVAAQAPAARR